MNTVEVPGNIDSSVDNYCSATRLEGDVCAPKNLRVDDIFAK